MAATNPTYFNHEEWKYIQAVLKYRLDLHFYLSQVQQTSVDLRTSHNSVMNPLQRYSNQHDLALFQRPPVLHPASRLTPAPNILSPPTTPVKTSLDSNPFLSGPVDLTVDKKLSNNLRSDEAGNCLNKVGNEVMQSAKSLYKSESILKGIDAIGSGNGLNKTGHGAIHSVKSLYKTGNNIFGERNNVTVTRNDLFRTGNDVTRSHKVEAKPVADHSENSRDESTFSDSSLSYVETSPTLTSAVTSKSVDNVERPLSEFVVTEDRAKRFGCPYPGCDYKSNRKNNLQRHKETMHHARAVAFSCCSKRFFRRADFDRHKMEQHRDGYFCTKCSKHFERRATLARHERSHDKETPFWCPYCYYRNGNESNNRRHIRKHEDVINGGIDSHWNPFSPLGSIAIVKEKLRPLHEVQILLAKFNRNFAGFEKRKLLSRITPTELPDSTT